MSVKTYPMLINGQTACATLRMHDEPTAEVLAAIGRAYRLVLTLFPHDITRWCSRADTDANAYNNWWIEHLFMLVPSQTVVKEFLKTFQEFPPSHRAARRPG